MGQEASFCWYNDIHHYCYDYKNVLGYRHKDTDISWKVCIYLIHRFLSLLQLAQQKLTMESVCTYLVNH